MLSKPIFAACAEWWVQKLSLRVGGKGTYFMAERKSPRSIKSTLLLLLLPAGIVLMAVAWVIHGWLLEQMSRDFVESRLKEEAQFLEQHLREMDGDLNQLAMGDYFEKVFHHAF